MKCVGAAACACGQECGLEWEGAGKCILEGSSCVVVPEIGLERCHDGQAYRYDGNQCVRCNDCCLDGPFGEYLFADLESCAAACHPGANCEPWGGDCSGESVVGSWWLFDGTGCRQSESCETPAPLGAYADQESCLHECGYARMAIDFISPCGHGNFHN